MLDKVLGLWAPHYCYGCDLVGFVLCSNCKYNIINEPFAGCVACQKTAVGSTGVCTECRVPYSKAWVISDRDGIVLKLVDEYKFNYRRSSYEVLAEMLNDTVASLPEDTLVCTVPTIQKHIRQRGFDHAKLLAKQFASLRRLEFVTPLARNKSTVQLGTSRVERIKNARLAFRARGVQRGRNYLLIDDVYTTGSTMRYATQTLLNAGAGQVWIAIIARQALDK